MFKPLYDTVIVEPEPVKSYEEQMGYEHVIVPDKWKVGPTDPPIWGRVVSIGDEVEIVLSGARVLFGKFAGARFKYDGVDYVAVKAHDVLAIDE